MSRRFAESVQCLIESGHLTGSVNDSIEVQDIMILCIGATPAAQRVMVFPSLKMDAVNRASSTFDGIAGKAVNVAKVLKTLEENPCVMGFIGGERGEQLKAALVARKIEEAFIRVIPETRQCITVIDQAAGQITELVEESRPVENSQYESLYRAIESRAAQARAMIMSGTITPGGPTGFYRQCVQMAKQRNLLTVVDAKGNLLMEALGAHPGLVKPNVHELESTMNKPLKTSQDIQNGMRMLHDQGAARVIITMGKGVVHAFDGSDFWQATPPEIKVLNAIGSGDAFTAALTLRLLKGDDLGESCRWGCAAGAANALTWMPGELNADDVERLAKEVRVVRIKQ